MSSGFSFVVPSTLTCVNESVTEIMSAGTSPAGLEGRGNIFRGI